MGVREAAVKYHSPVALCLMADHELAARQGQAGSLTGAVASQRVTEALKGSLKVNGHHLLSVKIEESLTARRTGRAGTKVGLSDPTFPSGRSVAQRIKATPGITG